MSRRCRPGMPASFSHTLRSTVQRCGPTIDCWEFSLTTPDGSGNAWNFSVFLSNFTIPDWNMCESQRLPSGSTSRSRVPFGRSEEHTSELQSHHDLVCRLLLEKKKN